MHHCYSDLPWHRIPLCHIRRAACFFGAICGTGPITTLTNGKEHELVITKGHILIEEQIRLIIDKNLTNPSVLKHFDCHKAICLAQSFFPIGHYTSIWESVKQLNSIRNSIAHKSESENLEKVIDDFIEFVPVDWSAIVDRSQCLELKLWALFAYVSSFIEGALDEDMQRFIPLLTERRIRNIKI